MLLAYVDEQVEARYEEIINHLHKALSSTEEDEQDFKVTGANYVFILAMPLVMGGLKMTTSKECHVYDYCSFGLQNLVARRCSVVRWPSAKAYTLVGIARSCSTPAHSLLRNTNPNRG